MELYDLENKRGYLCFYLNSGYNKCLIFFCYSLYIEYRKVDYAKQRYRRNQEFIFKGLS